jgi:hypothetical protein
MFHRWVKFLLFFCLMNVTLGSFAGAANSHARSSTSSSSVSQASDPGLSEAAPCAAPDCGDCDDEGCVSHQCHFGHCQVLTLSTVEPIHPALTGSLIGFRSFDCLTPDRKGPLKPPRA